MWKLIVIWEDCKREEFLYPTEKEAKEAEKAIKWRLVHRLTGLVLYRIKEVLNNDN